MFAFPLAVIGVGWGVIAIAGDDGLAAFVGFLAPSAVFGAIVQRWWTLWLPLGWTGAYLGAARIADLITGGCSVCGEDEDWSNFPLFVAVVWVAPLTVALFLGIIAGKNWTVARATGGRPSV
ncbi:MAG: hypothetical protein ACJ76Z_07375 [Thermoleophilaceae bacterium]